MSEEFESIQKAPKMIHSLLKNHTWPYKIKDLKEKKISRKLLRKKIFFECIIIRTRYSY